MQPHIFLELDALTRDLMRDEFNRDGGRPPLSKCFTGQGENDYPDLLADAILNGDAAWLIASLRQHGRMTETPVNAAERFGWTEFNRYYARGICRRALEHGSNEVKVYRARESRSKRPRSEQMIGTTQPATTLLDDLRTNRQDVAMGIALVASGLSVRCGCEGCLRAAAA